MRQKGIRGRSIGSIRAGSSRAFHAITTNFVTRRYLRFAGLANFGAANQLEIENNRRAEDKSVYSPLTGAIFRGVANFQRLVGPRTLPRQDPVPIPIPISIRPTGGNERRAKPNSVFGLSLRINDPANIASEILRFASYRLVTDKRSSAIATSSDDK